MKNNYKIISGIILAILFIIYGIRWTSECCSERYITILGVKIYSKNIEGPVCTGLCSSPDFFYDLTK